MKSEKWRRTRKSKQFWWKYFHSFKWETVTSSYIFCENSKKFSSFFEVWYIFCLHLKLFPIFGWLNKNCLVFPILPARNIFFWTVFDSQINFEWNLFLNSFNEITLPQMINRCLKWVPVITPICQLYFIYRMSHFCSHSQFLQKLTLANQNVRYLLNLNVLIGG